MSKNKMPWPAGPYYAEGSAVVVDSREQVCCGRGVYGECCGEPELVGDYYEVAECAPELAKLFSAAPDLLDACEQLLARATIYDDPHLLEQARAAIAKAKGEPE
jgi:hypothetical protein